MHEPIEVRVGEVFDVVLEALGSAGYRWTVAQHAEGKLEYLGDSWENPPGRPVGGRSLQHIQFRALAPGTVTLRFEYGRSWESVSMRTIDQVVHMVDNPD